MCVLAALGPMEGSASYDGSVAFEALASKFFELPLSFFGGGL